MTTSFPIMDLSSLSAKQKRIKEWKEFLEIADLAPGLREQVLASLELLGKLLADCWRKGACDAESAHQIESLERDLEGYNESIRLNSARTLGREFDN